MPSATGICNLIIEVLQCAVKAGQLSTGPNCAQDVTRSEQVLLKVFSIDPMADLSRQQRLRATHIMSPPLHSAQDAAGALFMEYVGAMVMGSIGRQS